MDKEQINFIERLTRFFMKDWEKGELNDREQIKEQLAEELKKY